MNKCTSITLNSETQNFEQMVMGLVLISMVTGLSLLDGDVTAAGLSPQQLQFLREWKMRNGNASQLQIVWQPASVPGTKPSRSRDKPKIPGWLRRAILSNRHGVLKAGYPAPASAAAPAPPQQRILVISAPAPSMSQPSKPAQPPAPPPMSSYNPPPQHQPMMMMSYPPPPQPAQYPAPNPHGSSMPAAMPMPETPTSYRVIYIQEPSEPSPPAMKPQQSQPSYPSHEPPPVPAMMSYPPQVAQTSMSKPQTPTAVQSSYSVSQAQTQQGGSYRIIHIQPPPEPAAPPPPAMKPAPSPYPSHEPAPKPHMMSYPPQAAPEPAAAEPQTLLVVVPSSASAKKSSAPAIPACSPAPAGFCNHKYAGHYEDPQDETCFIVCNKSGHAFSQRCAPGTKWKRSGYPASPAGYNRCA